MPVSTLLLTGLAMLAFAGNSILCRLAMTRTAIDPASFTTLRILSGALLLLGFIRLRDGAVNLEGDWGAALALVVYAAGFSFAYLTLATGTGALLLFGAVQGTMIGYGLWSGERLNLGQLGGMFLAGGGLIGLLLPGVTSPSLGGALLMLGAGAAWGVYSLRRGKDDPAAATAGNFLRALFPAVLLSLLTLPTLRLDPLGCLYALLSGSLASGAGYVLWYAALRHLKATSAATVQLSVPVLAAFGGVMLLQEEVSLRLFLAALAVLGGIFLFLACREGRAVDR